jgi:hypothetical protein
VGIAHPRWLADAGHAHLFNRRQTFRSAPSGPGPAATLVASTVKEEKSMRKRLVWTWMLALCLILALSAAASQAASQDDFALIATCDVLFTAEDPADEEVPGDTDEDDADMANIYCCAHHGSCVSTTAAKCVAPRPDGYAGTAHATLLACHQAGCT